jgi:hypothetical protein
MGLESCPFDHSSFFLQYFQHQYPNIFIIKWVL